MTSNEIDAIAAAIEERVTNAVVGRLEPRFEAIDQRLDAMDQRLDAMDQRLDAMDRNILSLARSVEAVVKRQGETAQVLRALAEHLGVTESVPA